MPSTPDYPSCFGTKPVARGEGVQWDPKDNTCNGTRNPDGTLARHRNGQVIDPQCAYYDACREDLRSHGLLPAQALVKTGQQAPVPIAQFRPNTVPIQRQQQQPVVMHQPAPQIMYVQQPQHMQVPQQMAQSFQPMPVNYAMPSYLTALEPDRAETKWKALMVEAFRSVGKAFGHSVSYFFDSVPLMTHTPKQKVPSNEGGSPQS